MSKLKKIITSGFEIVKDSAKQIADTVSPGALIEHALGTKKSSDTMGDYLRNLGDPSLSGDKLKQKEMEIKSEDEKKLEEARKILSGVPVHMKLPPKQPGPRAYEVTVQDMDRKQAQAIEAQKKQSQSAVAPKGKQQRGSLFAKRKTSAKGFEGLVKDTKVG